MATAPNSDHAYADYLNGMKYKDIAAKYGVTINTVKSWKSRYQWSRDGKKSVHTKSKKVCTQKTTEKSQKKDAETECMEELSENTELTEKQRLFCIYYVRCFNATKAYQKAYGCSYETAMYCGSRMLRNVKIKNEIQNLKQNKLNRELLSEADIFQKYMDIAFSDITDYMEFGTEEVPVMTMYGPAKIKDEKTGKEKTLTKIVNVARFKDSANVDGTIIAEVKQGRDGAGIKLADRMKAMQWLSDHMDLASTEQKARIEKLQMETQKIMPEPPPEKEYTGIPATMVAPVFAPVLFDIQEQRHTEYVFPGGRGSTKSSFVSLNIIDLIMKNPEMHAVVMRQVADTMRGSIYQQVKWAIDALGLSEEFDATVSPLEITRKEKKILNEEYDQECSINLDIEDYRAGVNHLVCAGEGENQDRTILHLYVQEDGTIGDEQYYYGLDEVAAVYIFTSADANQLRQDGMKRLKDLQNYKKCQMTIEDADLEIGDIVAGYDEVTDTTVMKPIKKKILKINDGQLTIDYEVKGDD